jgi:hypothetical protein
MLPVCCRCAAGVLSMKGPARHPKAPIELYPASCTAKCSTRIGLRSPSGPVEFCQLSRMSNTGTLPRKQPEGPGGPAGWVTINDSPSAHLIALRSCLTSMLPAAGGLPNTDGTDDSGTSPSSNTGRAPPPHHTGSQPAVRPILEVESRDEDEEPPRRSTRSQNDSGFRAGRNPTKQSRLRRRMPAAHSTFGFPIWTIHVR